nr:ATP-dependent DNA helicase PIF1-like [Parasteatoda tepidariorum]
MAEPLSKKLCILSKKKILRDSQRRRRAQKTSVERQRRMEHDQISTSNSRTVINKKLLKKLPGALEIYKSINAVMEIDQVVNYQTEFLNSLEPPGVPAHKLELKIGAPIMLLRNLDPPALCNETRLIVKKLMPNVIEAMIITGHSTGNSVLIPRIPIISSDIPFQFKRLSFAKSINKSQGQSLKVVGLDFQKPCFSHGQLYVGCSRVGDEKNLYLLAPNGKTNNIVYKEVLQE